MRDALNHSMRVTSADRVKVSSPIHTKTKTYLDTFSNRSWASATSYQGQSSRREKNMSKASIRTYESIHSKKKSSIANKDEISLGFKYY